MARALIKIHKPEKAARILLPFKNNPAREYKYVIKISKDFVNKLFKLNIERNDVLISADVVNLYPSIPQSDAIDYALKLLSLVNDSAIFKFNNKYYEQVKGLPMGANNSPIMAECVILRSYINFTIESEVDNEIHFLDVSVQRYRQPFKTKKSVVYALVQRAFNIISDVENIATELNYIRPILMNNNYPFDIINN
ncbi:hypothetical protein B4U80_05303, partial [Leptotrombidium deliense]